MQGYAITFTEKAIDFIAKAGFDPIYGARPLSRALRKTLENPLSAQLLQGDYVPGDSILVDGGEGGLSIGKK